MNTFINYCIKQKCTDALKQMVLVHFNKMSFLSILFSSHRAIDLKSSENYTQNVIRQKMQERPNYFFQLQKPMFYPLFPSLSHQPPHHVSTGLVLMQPAGLVLHQLLPTVAHRRPPAARLLGGVDQPLAVGGPGAGRVEDLAGLHPADLAITQQVSHKLLALGWDKRQWILNGAINRLSVDCVRTFKHIHSSDTSTENEWCNDLRYIVLYVWHILGVFLYRAIVQHTHLSDVLIKYNIYVPDLSSHMPMVWLPAIFRLWNYPHINSLPKYSHHLSKLFK